MVIIGQHALLNNVVSFAQDLEHAIEILNELPLSLKSLFDFLAIHFVSNTHPPITRTKGVHVSMYAKRFH